ncbi:trypsin-like peptidase domain-containing protein [Cyanobacteria bacterium FACHB-502]|nr:trypsin-like peptidase domain-containing protein [Cyanobacteria bacterium FACHB-502]
MEDDLPATNDCVNVLLKRLQPNFALFHLLNQCNQVFERSAEAIEPPDDEGVPFSSKVKALLQPRAIGPTPYLKSVGSALLSNGAENNVKPDTDSQEKSQWDLPKIQLPFLSFVQQPQTIARNDPDCFTAEVWIQTNAGAAPASGIIIREDGLILTNHHVIANGLLYVKLKDGRQFQGRTIASDQSLDLALVQLDGAANLLVAALAQSANVKVGDTVRAIGSPMGSHWKHTEASVIVINSDCGLQALNGKCIRTPSGFLYPGNSGGPLLNDRGEVFGVNRAIQESSGEGVSIPMRFSGSSSKCRRAKVFYVRNCGTISLLKNIFYVS